MEKSSHRVQRARKHVRLHRKRPFRRANIPHGADQASEQPHARSSQIHCAWPTGASDRLPYSAADQGGGQRTTHATAPGPMQFPGVTIPARAPADIRTQRRKQQRWPTSHTSQAPEAPRVATAQRPTASRLPDPDPSGGQAGQYPGKPCTAVHRVTHGRCMAAGGTLIHQRHVKQRPCLAITAARLATQQNQMRRNTSVPLVPPNPKLF